jgi:hypothetical protein
MKWERKLMTRATYLVTVAIVLVVTVPLWGATYYVDATGGLDANDGLSPATAWKTMSGSVNIKTFAPGDQILFKRGEVWRESLVVPSSGASGNPIVFDAYGTGEAPTITGYFDLPSAAWSLDSGSVWKAAMTATGMNYVLFGSIWGQKQTTKSAVQNDRDFYLSSNVLYVYSQGNPATYYGSVAAMLMTNGQLIYVTGKSWVQIQHFKLSYFDTYGVRIGGASDHITIANVDSEGMIPAGTTPHGFYVNASPAPTEVKFYNVDAHRNYNGLTFNGSANGIVVRNCRAYANRNHGLEDNTSGSGVDFDYCHFYANGLGVVTSTDTTGGVAGAGGHDVPAYSAPQTVSFLNYPARITLTVDDPGLVDSSAYVDSLLPQFDSRGLQLSIGIVTGYEGSNQMIPKFQEWINAGRDVNSHSWSHQYFLNTPGFSIKYTGTGTAAAMTIAGTTLTTTVTGGPGGENLSFDLANPSYNTLSSLVTAINGRSGYTASLLISSATDSVTLLPVVAVDIKTTTYTAQFRYASAFAMRYVGTGTGATVSINAGHLMTTVTGGPGGENIDLDLTNAAYDTMSELAATINGRSGYSAAMVSTGKGAAHSTTLATVSTQDIKSSQYVMQVAENLLEPDEMSTSKAWMNANLTGLPATRAYVYPGGQEDTSTQGYAAVQGYAGARGAFTMDLGTKDVYAKGVNIQNITSFGANPSLQGLAAQQMDAQIGQLVWKSAVWGAPYGVFWHNGELTAAEVGNLLDALTAHGATVITNTQLVSWILGTSHVGTTGYYYVTGATGPEADLRPSSLSPVVNAGTDLGALFAYDLEGKDQRAFGSGWEMGAYAVVGHPTFVIVVE